MFLEVNQGTFCKKLLGNLFTVYLVCVACILISICTCELQKTVNRRQKMHQSHLLKFIVSLVLLKLGPVRMTWSSTIRASDITAQRHRPEILSKFSFLPKSLTVTAQPSFFHIFKSLDSTAVLLPR